MAVIMEGGSGKPTMVVQRVEFVGFYLACAFRAAKTAVEPQSTADENCRLENALLIVIWSAMALESAANRIAEDVLSEKDFSDFDSCRKRFHKPSDISKSVWKWRMLFAEKGARLPITESFLQDAQKLMHVRNAMSHYKMTESSRKLYFDPPATIPGQPHMLWDAGWRPSKVELSLAEKELMGQNPARFYNYVRTVLMEWELVNGRDGQQLKEFPPLDTSGVAG